MCHLSQVEGGVSRIVNKVISREIPRLRAAIVRACLFREIFRNARDEENRGPLILLSEIGFSARDLFETSSNNSSWLRVSDRDSGEINYR